MERSIQHSTDHGSDTEGSGPGVGFPWCPERSLSSFSFLDGIPKTQPLGLLKLSSVSVFYRLRRPRLCRYTSPFVSLNKADYREAVYGFWVLKMSGIVVDLLIVGVEFEYLKLLDFPRMLNRFRQTNSTISKSYFSRPSINYYNTYYLQIQNEVHRRPHSHRGPCYCGQRQPCAAY